MVNKTKQSILALILFFSGLCVLFASLNSNLLLQTVSADDVTYQVDIGGARPSISSVRCCFKDSGAGVYADADCEDPDGSFTMSEATNYDMMCNFTVTDNNGWQDMTDGWVNVTWRHEVVAWNAAEDEDTLYVNTTCKNVTGTESGTTIVFECGISGIRYWADGGNWTLLVNLTDGTGAGNPGTEYFTISNVTSIWQQTEIDFGTMSPGETGSEAESGTVNVNAKTNNTGNTIIDLNVDGQEDYMNCSIGALSIGAVEYDTVDSTDIDLACGQLTSASIWDGDCSDIGLGDCTDTCPNTEKLTTTYWGLTVPPTGVGGSCSRTIIFAGVQANP